MRSLISRAIFLAGLGLFPLTSAQAQTNPFMQKEPLFEFVQTLCAKFCDRETTLVYEDGRYVIESYWVTRRTARSHSFKMEKHLTSQEVAMLKEWAREPDFLNAHDEYSKTVIDY